MAPILVMPDYNGSAQDTECSNTHLGRAETYLTRDVPDYLVSQFDAAPSPRRWAVAGLSAGALCATMLSLRNPDVFSTFASYSGFLSPTYLDDSAAQTIQVLYGGSTKAYEAHNPIHLLTSGHRFRSLAAWFSAGAQDSSTAPATRQLAAAAMRDGMRQVCLTIPPGTHSFQFWSQAFHDSLPWLAWQLGLTPAPRRVPARCRPPVR